MRFQGKHGPIVGAIVGLALGCFVAAKNPEWETGFRLIFVVFSMFMGVLAGGIVWLMDRTSINDDDSQTANDVEPLCCPKCGQSNEPQASTCVKCGQSLTNAQ